MGTIAAIWIFARMVIWGLPENSAVDPGEAATHAAVSADIAQTGNAKPDNMGKLHRSVRIDAAKTEDRTDRPDKPYIDRADNEAVWPYMDSHYSLPAARLPFGSERLLRDQWAQQPEGLRQTAKKSLPALERKPQKPSRNGLRTYVWFFVRQDDSGKDASIAASGTAVSNGQYGGSQAGAIVSHPVWSEAGAELSVYGRLTAALEPFGQEEVALGATVIPARNIPIKVHIEQRFDAYSAGNRGTAFYMSGGTGPDRIVEEVVFETYGQAGYILGKNETHFFDGSATMLRPVTKLSSTSLSIGAGLWVGGQRGTSRLDVGPRVDIRIPVAAVSARVSADWRSKIAGNARPGSGLTLTVATSF